MFRNSKWSEVVYCLFKGNACQPGNAGNFSPNKFGGTSLGQTGMHTLTWISFLTFEFLLWTTIKISRMEFIC